MKLEFYRNIPFIDNKKPFFWQRFNRSIWIEVPFIGVRIRTT